MEKYQRLVRKGYVKDRNELTQSGKQRKGSAPFTKRPPDVRSKFAPVGFDGLEEELEVDVSGFRIHDELEPQIWDNEEIKPEIREYLLEIARDFIDGLPFEVSIEDVRLTGSLANYNWSRYSDIDLHIVVDFAELDENKKLVKAFFDQKRLRWNDIHDIKIKGYDVEIYVEDLGEEHKSTGVYSIENNEWLTHPEAIDRPIDIDTATKKASDIEQQIASVESLFGSNEFEKVMRHVDRIKNKIKNMRQAGLESEEMEFSPENIAFKLLRRSMLLNKLTKLKYNAYDRSMTLDD